MAAYGEASGNQLFVTIFKGKTWPPVSFDVRLDYSQTVGDFKAAVQSKTGIPPAQQQFFWHGKELTAAYDGVTLTDMQWHTGFGIRGYDLSDPAHPPHYNPPLEPTAEGLAFVKPPLPAGII